MKNLLRFMTGLAFTFGIIYLAGVFYSLGFNISEWSEGARFTVAFFGTFLGVICGLFVVNYYSEE